jgi:hypothetical protein
MGGVASVFDAITFDVFDVDGSKSSGDKHNYGGYGGYYNYNGYSSYDDQHPRYPNTQDYNYISCYRDRPENRALPHYLGQVSNAEQCGNLAYKNNSKYFGLHFYGQCWGSNGKDNTYARYGKPSDTFDRDENYLWDVANEAWFDRCKGNINGESWMNHTYELYYTQDDENEVYTNVSHTLMIVDGQQNEISTILVTVNNNNDNIKRYLANALAALTTGDSFVNSAKTNSDKAFNSSASALQDAEKARRLSQDITKQKEASIMAETAAKSANDSLTFVNNSNNDISNANTNYSNSALQANSGISEGNNISSKMTNSQTYFNTANTNNNTLNNHYNNNWNKYNYIFNRKQNIKYIYDDIKVKLDSANTKLLEIRNIVNNTILPNITTITGYLNRANDKTQINSINNVITQSNQGANVALVNANNILASTKLQLARLSNLDAIEKKQESQKAAADAAQRAILQAEEDAAKAKQTELNLLAASARATQAQLAYERSLVQIDTINKQNNLMSKLNQNIINVNNITTIEGFANVEPLATSNNQEINNYVNTFNNNLSLVNDPNNMNKVAFETYLHIQDTKLSDLKKNVLNLQQTALSNKNKNSQIKGIRSINNSTNLNVEEFPDPENNSNNVNNDQDSTYKGNGSKTYPNYLIYGNNGCLKYEPSTSNTPSTWDFKKCDSNDPKQQFNINKIKNLQQYNAPITNPNNQNYIINHESNVNFGFYSVNPSVEVDQCLQLNNDGISVMPCNMDSSQRFSANYKTIQ